MMTCALIAWLAGTVFILDCALQAMRDDPAFMPKSRLPLLLVIAITWPVLSVWCAAEQLRKALVK